MCHNFPHLTCNVSMLHVRLFAMLFDPSPELPILLTFQKTPTKLLAMSWKKSLSITKGKISYFSCAWYCLIKLFFLIIWTCQFLLRYFCSNNMLKIKLTGIWIGLMLVLDCAPVELMFMKISTNQVTLLSVAVKLKNHFLAATVVL